MNRIFSSDLFKNIGTGFFMGQGFALVRSAKNSLQNAPSGNKIHHFWFELRSSSLSMGVNTANWSLIQGLIDPYIKIKIKEYWKQNIVSGFLAGSILEWRNGFKSMFKSGMTGAIQSGFMFYLSNGLANIAENTLPTQYNLQTEFFEKRNKFVFRNPFESLISVYFPIKKIKK